MIKESQDKILPYVYKLTHKETNQFYIGYRAINKVRSEFDLGFKYFSSSKKVKELGFENFDIEIMVEFFDAKDAYDFEQELIKENFKDPLCLNRNYNVNGTSVVNNTGKKFTKEHKDKLSSRKLGRKLSTEHKRKISISNKGKNSGKIRTQEHKDKLSKSLSNRVHSEETKNKISTSLKISLSDEKIRERISIRFKGKPKSKEHKMLAGKKSGSTRKNAKLMKHPSEEKVKYIKMEDIEEYINKGYSFVNRKGVIL